MLLELVFDDAGSKRLPPFKRKAFFSVPFQTEVLEIPEQMT
jgi:hypothetical protein